MAVPCWALASETLRSRAAPSFQTPAERSATFPPGWSQLDVPTVPYTCLGLELTAAHFLAAEKSLQQTWLRRARATVRTLDPGCLTAWRNAGDAFPSLWVRNPQAFHFVSRFAQWVPRNRTGRNKRRPAGRATEINALVCLEELVSPPPQQNLLSPNYLFLARKWAMCLVGTSNSREHQAFICWTKYYWSIFCGPGTDLCTHWWAWWDSFLKYPFLSHTLTTLHLFRTNISTNPQYFKFNSQCVCSFFY